MCSHCTLLNNQLGASLPVNHASTECGRKSVAISLIESIPTQEVSDVSASSTDEGQCNQNFLSSNMMALCMYGEEDTLHFFLKLAGQCMVLLNLPLGFFLAHIFTPLD